MNKMLIVDDELTDQKVIENYFRNENFVVDSVSTTKEAITKFELNDYDVILCDIKLPNKKEGLALVEEFREIERNNASLRCLIFFHTAIGNYPLAQEASILDVDGFIQKPVDLGKLNSIIQNKLQERIDKDIMIRTLKEWSKKIQSEEGGDEPILKLGPRDFTADEIIREIEQRTVLGKEFRKSYYNMLFELSRPFDNETIPKQ